MAEVIELRPGSICCAKCPECSGSLWEILLDAMGDEWDNITGTRCSECGFIVDWVTCHRSHEDDDG